MNRSRPEARQRCRGATSTSSPSRSRRSCWRCCRPCSTRRSSPPRCRRSPPTSGASADVSWVVTAYVVAAAATTPLWGKLGDRHGRKRAARDRAGAVLVASAAVRPRQDITLLIAARMIQGVAAGGLMTLAMAAVGDLVSPRERGPLPGLHRRDVRAGDRRRAAARRCARRACELALGLLRQPAARRSPRSPACACGCPRRRPTAPEHRSTLPAPALLDGAPRAPSCSPASGAAPATPGVRRRSSACSPRGRCSEPRSCVARAARRRPDRPARAAAHAGRRGRQHGAVPRHRGAVCDHRVRAAVPADDDRRDAHAGRAAAGAGDARHHRLDQPRRARDLAHRPLQALPGRRPRR